MKKLLFTGIEQLDDLLQKSVCESDEAVLIDSFEQLELDSDEADVIIVNRYMDSTDDGELLQRSIKRLRQNNKNLQVVILMVEKEVEFIQAMVSVGVYDVILCHQGESLESLHQRLIKVMETPSRSFDFNMLMEQEVQQEKGVVKQDSEGVNWSLKIQRRPIIQSAFKEVIAVYSPSNSGATTTALNLGIALTESKKCKVLVMGLDLMTSVMGARLKKIPLMTIYQMVDAQKKRIPINEVIEDAVVTFGKVDVMPGNFDLTEYYYLGETDLWRLIRELQKIYDYIVLDISSYLTDKVTAISLNKANRVYLVSEATKAHLGHLEKYKAVIKTRFPDVNFRGVIINKFNGASLTSIEIETLIGQKPVTIINSSSHLTAVDGIINRKRIAKAYKNLVKDVIN